MTDELFKQLPKMDQLINSPQLEGWSQVFPKQTIKDLCNQVLQETRQKIVHNEIDEVNILAIITEVDQKLEGKNQPSLKQVVNATGTVLHTNLGRSLISESIIKKLHTTSMHYSNLEYDIPEGRRGSRYDHVEELICELTGCEAALIVNNNAAGVMLLLSALLPNKEILVSRGELVEIGGSFRIPDVIESVGATLKEVGATNKTHLADYQRAISEETGAILRVHTSNYKIVGFADKPDDSDLVKLAHNHNIPAFNDLGSGSLLDLQEIGLPYEPTVSDTVKAGFDVVTFSGDKLLGGPQAGILVGKKEYIDQLKKHPLLRALRVDKFTIAALEYVLMEYRNPKTVFEKVLPLKLLSQSQECLEEKAMSLQESIQNIGKGYQTKLVAGNSQVGGGAYPGVKLPTTLVEVNHDSLSESVLERRLRLSKNHIIARISDGKIQFDVRTLIGDDIDRIADTLADII